MDPLLFLLTTFVIISLLAAVFWPGNGLFSRWQRTRTLTNRVFIEDALKHIFTYELENRSPTLHSIAGALAISPNEVAGIVEQLEAQEFLSLENGDYRMTAAGREYALRVIRAHRLWERYLSEHTGYAQVDWHDLAEQKEHNLSPEESDALAFSLGNPSHDPHGDPIPTAQGELAPPVGVPLTSLALHENALIVHIEDEPVVIYDQIIAEGLHTGMNIRILDTSARRIRYWANGNEHDLAPLLAKNITVVPQQIEAQSPFTGIPLTRLELGETAQVAQLSPAIRGAERRRLMDLGLLPGTEITAELQSPSGDPTAYLVRGALIALRAEQAQHVQITTNGLKA